MTSGFELPPCPLAEFHSYVLFQARHEKKKESKTKNSHVWCFEA